MIALLLPSYRRFHHLSKVLDETPVDERARFVVVANYDDAELALLQERYGDRAEIVDERPYGKMGVVKAYNLAFARARELEAEYAVLWADDVVPASPSWLDELEEMVVGPRVAYGILSSDEGHQGHFGWNFLDRAPIGHFFIVRGDRITDELFSTEFRQYYVDLEISVRLLERGEEVHLLPILVRHWGAPEHRERGVENSRHDQAVFLRLYPQYAPFMGTKVPYLLPHRDEIIVIDSAWQREGLVYPPEEKASLAQRVRRLAGRIRRRLTPVD